MTTIAEVEVPAEMTVLADTFERFPDIEVRMEHVVATEQGEVMPFVWVSGVAGEDAETALLEDPTATEVRKVDEQDGSYLYKVTFVDGMHILSEIIFEHDGTILEVAGSDATWQLLLRFPERGDFADAYDKFEEYDFRPSLVDIHRLDTDSGSPRGLTAEQYEILNIAHEMGHYDVPRETTLEAVADRLGISRQAASERLRRAHKSVVDDYLSSNSNNGE